jgi:hypothetical protein
MVGVDMATALELEGSKKEEEEASHGNESWTPDTTRKFTMADHI